jgi:hypothetical protein
MRKYENEYEHLIGSRVLNNNNSSNDLQHEKRNIGQNSVN